MAKKGRLRAEGKLQRPTLQSTALSRLVPAIVAYFRVGTLGLVGAPNRIYTKAAKAAKAAKNLGVFAILATFV